MAGMKSSVVWISVVAALWAGAGAWAEGVGRVVTLEGRAEVGPLTLGKDGVRAGESVLVPWARVRELDRSVTVPAAAEKADAGAGHELQKPSAVAPGFGGLTVRYFDDLTFQRCVGTQGMGVIDVRWEWEHYPVAGMSSDRYSVRWSGRLMAPTTGKYKLVIEADDDGRLVLDGKELIDTRHNVSAEVELVAGKAYPLVVEVSNGGGGPCAAHFRWQRPGDWKQDIVPPECLGIDPAEGDGPPLAVLTAGLGQLVEGGGALGSVIQAGVEGRGAVPARVELVEGEKVVAVLTKAPWRLLGAQLGSGRHTVYAVVTDSLGRMGRSAPVTVQVDSAAGDLLAGPWTDSQIGDDRPPLRLAPIVSGGGEGQSVLIAAGGGEVRLGEDQLRFLRYAMGSNGRLEAGLAVKAPAGPVDGGLCGMMLREGLWREARYVAAVAGRDGKVSVMVRRQSGQLPQVIPTEVSLPVTLCLTRQGNVVELEAVTDGQRKVLWRQWVSGWNEAHGGFFAIGRVDQEEGAEGAGGMGLEARNVRMSRVGEVGSLPGPGLVLVDGSFLAGGRLWGSVEGWRADLRERRVEADLVSCVAFGPVVGVLRRDVRPEAGVLTVAGDWLAGTVSRIDEGWEGGVTADTLLGGPTRLEKGKGAVLACIRMGRQASGLVLVLKDGSRIVWGEATGTEAGVVPASGTVWGGAMAVVRWDDVVMVRREAAADGGEVVR